MLKLGLILASPFLLVALVVGATGIAVVDVHEGGPDGTHLVVPVPLILAQAALTFAPHEAKYVECPDLAPYEDLADEIVRELRKAPDFTLIEVHDAEDDVIIRKVDGVLDISVRDGEDDVHCRVPLKSAQRLIAAYDGHGFPTKAAVWALRDAPRGELVHVTDGEDEVRIRIL